MSSNMTTNDGLEKKETLKTGPGTPLSSKPQPLKHSSKPQVSILLDLRPLFEIWENLKGDILERKTEPEYRIGLNTIDDLLWGVHKKELMTIGSRTSHGKSSFAINMVRHLADTGNRIIYFSLEMSKEQLLEKLMCNFCVINNLDLRHGKAKKEFLERETVFYNWINNIKLVIDDKYGYDFSNMIKVCELIKPDFVIVDYIQMISTKGYRSKVDAIEEYVRKFAELAVTKNFGAILISQINRSGVDEPTMSKFKWAGVLEEHSATCLVLNYNASKGTYKIHIEKQRHGEVKDVSVKFEPQYSRFRDLTQDEEIEIEQSKPKKKFGGLYQQRD